MSYFILEMKVICVEGLEEFNLISSSNLSVYVMVILKGASLKDQNAKTNMVELGAQNPSWNYEMKFFIDRSKQIQALKSHLMFTIITKNNEEHKNVGQINVPIVELMQSFKHENSLQTISYSVKKFSSRCTTKGTFNFAFKFVPPEAQLQSPRTSSSLSPSSSSALQSKGKEQEEPVKKRGKWKGIGTKLIMGLAVSVGGGSISKIIFDHGQKDSPSANYLPSSSSAILSPDFFYDNGAPPISTSQDVDIVVDPTESFYYNGSPLAAFPDTDTSVVSDLATSFYADGSPLASVPWDATSIYDPAMSANGFSDAHIDYVDCTTLNDGDANSLLNSVVDGVFSSFC